MSDNITVSYIIATKNKLPYLKNGLEKLITNKKPDEEILVADGASSDGTKEFLSEILSRKQIDYFISEPDYGLAHALNKLVLKARGSLIKYLSDDDAFDYSAIQTCKKFMLEHPDIDLVNTEGGSLNDPSRSLVEQDPLQIVRALEYVNFYKKWQANHRPFFYCDLGVMFRKSSLPVVGFWNPLFPGPDIEFSLRTSAGRVKMAWCTGYSYVNISNPQSVSMVFMKRTKKLTERLSKFYLNKNPEPLIIQKLKIIANKLHDMTSRTGSLKNDLAAIPFEKQWPKLVEISENWMRIKNTQRKPEFIWNK
ncbi:MAG: hypothetical protein RL557_277 [archaeon]|jgi:glycosyltransferase involved in cell wall biosynthesis